MTKEKSAMEPVDSLFKKYYAPLVAYACKFVADSDIAREIVQDFFARLLEKKDSISIDSSIKSYLYRSVYNCCINYIKQRAIQDKHIKNIEFERSIEDNLENEINTIELQHKIFLIIEKMPAQCKKIFMMNRMQGYKNEEIAAELKLSKRTVETQISKAIKILRNNLKNYLDKNNLTG
jgi:RNA polymerase sigma-70 factor (family 1)